MSSLNALITATADVAEQPPGAPPTRKGLRFTRHFTVGLPEGRTPFDEVLWEKRVASISNDKGEILFEQEGVTVPAEWSQTATNIVASKYFHGKLGSPEREHSVAQLVRRVADTIADWGAAGSYFAGPQDTEAFRDELAHLLLTQKAAFNSPVWFNVGVQAPRGSGWCYDAESRSVRPLQPGEHRPQCSACFIISVNDTLESILDLAKTEGMLFKWGSGSGSNLSAIREHDARLSGGGRASGPLSFMKGFDSFAGVIKSGGKTRRAAKMVILNTDHPDIEDFVTCKGREERKAHALIDAGYDASLDGEAYSSVFFQNANNSVRATDDFMQAASDDREFWTLRRKTGERVRSLRAKELLRKIAEATHQCGDPGMQFDTTINRWHTCKSSGRINASNPCSEYMFVDDSACNLASLNLLKFADPIDTVDVQSLKRAVDILITAQDILVDNASYPTEAIARNSHAFRPLGLGFANLGAFLMATGVPYDSDEGRGLAAGISALMTGQAYATSACLAGTVGPFDDYRRNAEPFQSVMRAHHDAALALTSEPLRTAALHCWRIALSAGRNLGYRNAQTTVLAPTGTIGFMMDCDTTGIEPDLALVKHKKLVGGGVLEIVNQTVPRALSRLGYTANESAEIVTYVDAAGTIEGASHLHADHLAVFDCSLRPQHGQRFIHHMGHIKMMAAVQPFISGAISKTINMPEHSTVEDIMDAYVQSWRLGLKAVAIYRDNSKRVQPLSSSSSTQSATHPEAPREQIVYRPIRRKLPDERKAITHKFSIGGVEGYITVGLYDDGSPGEVFITMAKEGSTISGLMDAFATAVSYALQYGVPLKFFVDKFSHLRFEPSGWTGNPQVPYAKSIMDYIFRWIGAKFFGPEYATSDVDTTLTLKPTEPSPQQALPFTDVVADAPLCGECGSMMTRNGSCHKCPNCGGTSGCS